VKAAPLIMCRKISHGHCPFVANKKSNWHGCNAESWNHGAFLEAARLAASQPPPGETRLANFNSAMDL